MRVKTLFQAELLHPTLKLSFMSLNALGTCFQLQYLTFTDSTTVGDFFMPKGTLIVPFLAGIMLDGEKFPEPRSFIPERYITEQNEFKSHPSVIPYGVGKRRCLGENLAKTEIIYFFFAIMKNFSVQLPIGAPKPSTEYQPG